MYGEHSRGFAKEAVVGLSPVHDARIKADEVGGVVRVFQFFRVLPGGRGLGSPSESSNMECGLGR